MTRRIQTAGYRGPLTYYLYLPPGTYLVEGGQMGLSEMTIPAELADYLVKIGKGEELEPVQEEAEIEQSEVSDTGKIRRTTRRAK